MCRDSDAGSPADALGLRQLEELQAHIFSAAGPTDATATAFVKACKLSTLDRRAVWVPDTLAAQLLFRLAENGALEGTEQHAMAWNGMSSIG